MTATADRPSTTRSAPGREQVLDTAEQLFARRGIDAVSLREITVAARQRNASVIHYHFGSRGGLLAAIIERHMRVVDAARSALITDSAAPGRMVDPHLAMGLLVKPLAECLATPSGRNYLRILQHLADRPSDSDHPAVPLAESNPSVRQVAAMLKTATQHLPEVLRRERYSQTTSFLFRALADRAAQIDAGGDGAREQPLDHALFVANLADVLVAVLITPPSPETTDLGSMSAAEHRD